MLSLNGVNLLHRACGSKKHNWWTVAGPVMCSPESPFTSHTYFFSPENILQFKIVKFYVYAMVVENKLVF